MYPRADSDGTLKKIKTHVTSSRHPVVVKGEKKARMCNVQALKKGKHQRDCLRGKKPP